MSESIVDITIFDTTLRDGAQSLPVQNQFPEGSKAEIADNIASQGIRVIEAGFPRTKGDKEEVEEVARTVGNKNYMVDEWQNSEHKGVMAHPPVIAGLSRTTPEDIAITWEAVQYAQYPRIHTFISTDTEHITAKFPGKSPDQVLEMGRRAVILAKRVSMNHPGATVEFSAEAASTTDGKYLERVVKTAVDAGADIINVPDTVGQRDPFWMTDFYRNVINWIHSINPGVVVSAHNHNDLDMATANTMALVRAAADFSVEGNLVNIQAETTICGLGERAGNTDVYPFVLNLFKHSSDMEGVEINWRFNPRSSVDTARIVMGFADLVVDRQNPVVGSDTLVHRSGIHSDGVIKGGHRIYTPHDPSFWGHVADAIHEEGKYQGRRGKEAIATATI